MPRPQVTSMSVDTHKFAQAHKGTSVVLYRSEELRSHQFTCITDWTGGLWVAGAWLPDGRAAAQPLCTHG
jgi:sphinganine-1-phosphate aldolase